MLANNDSYDRVCAPFGKARFAGRCGASSKKRNAVQIARKRGPSVGQIGLPAALRRLPNQEIAPRDAPTRANRFDSIIWVIVSEHWYETRAATETERMTRYLWGRYSPAVAWITLLGLLADQASKLWLLHGYGLGERGGVALTPFLDIVLVWNRGISYGLLQQDGNLGRWALAGFTVLASMAIWAWSVKAENRLQALGLALILGGAIGNGIDRLVYGAVVDFVYFHLGTFSWYVFNLADAWIVAGVATLLYEWAIGGPKNAAN